MRGFARAGAAWGIFALGLVAPPVHASDLRVSAMSAAEAYAWTRASGNTPSITRRRLVQYLGLSWQDILAPKDPKALRRDPKYGQLEVVTQMRVRHAFGDVREQALGRARTLINAREQRQIDLLFAYLEGRRLGRVLDLRVGRQLDAANTDFFAMDGAWIRLSPPGHARRLVQLELWGGAQVRTDSPLGQAAIAFEQPDLELDPNAIPKERGTLLGVAVATQALHGARFRVGYRRAFSALSTERPEQALPEEVTQLSAFSQGVEQSIAFGQASWAYRRRIFVDASSSYDLALRGISLANAAITGVLAPGHRLRLSWMRSLPVLDLDSIFSVFDLGPFQETRLRYTWTPTPRWQLAARVHMRHQRDPQIDFGRAGAGGVISLAFAHRAHLAQLHARTHMQEGRWQVSQLGRWRWSRTRSPWSADLWVHHAQSLQRERRYALSGALSGQYRFLSGFAVRGLVEVLTTESFRQSTRVFAALTMDATLRVGGR